MKVICLWGAPWMVCGDDCVNTMVKRCLSENDLEDMKDITVLDCQLNTVIEM